MVIEPIHQALIDRAGADMARPAIGWRGGALTWGELRGRVLAFARCLREAGVADGDRVVIALPKGAESAVAILGTLTAGATYVPLDVSMPPARAAAILADAQPAALVAKASSRVLADWSRGSMERDRCVIIAPPDLGAALPISFADGAVGAGAPFGSRAVDMERAAAILYTSGSTGDPKGVVLSHRNIGSFVRWAIVRFGLGPGDRFCSHARFHFDLSTLDLFAPIALGAYFYVLDEAVLSFPPAITRIIEQEHVSVWYATPSALQLIASHGALDRRDLSSLRWILFAGEVFSVPALRRLMAQLQAPGYANLYGPTETNVCTSYIVNTPPDEGSGPLPIGVPRDDLEVGVFGDDGQPLAAGEVGEICVSGPAVMLEYWRRPDLTAAARRLGQPDTYRTGDFGRVDVAGDLHFLGRRDHQVKVQGHRLDLLDVERHLASHPQVASAAVVMDGEPGRIALVAFVATSQGETLDVMTLRRHCAASLPVWAVPARFTCLPDLPLTTTGKVDRQQLTRMARGETMASRNRRKKEIGADV